MVGDALAGSFNVVDDEIVQLLSGGTMNTAAGAENYEQLASRLLERGKNHKKRLGEFAEEDTSFA